MLLVALGTFGANVAPTTQAARAAVSFYPASGFAMVVASPNGLVINEVYESQTPANEYFELYNTSNVPIDLATYVIYNRDGSTPLSRLSNTVISPGQFRAIGPAQLNTPTIGGPTGLDRTDFLGLVNTSPTDTVIDVVNWGGAPNPGWPNYERFAQYFFTANIPQLPASDGPRSLQRWPDGLDSDTGTDFAAITSSPSSPSCGDPFEDDNASNRATEQTPGSSALHRLCPAGDQDWVAVVMSTANTYTLYAQAQGNQVDLTMRLYDASGALQVENNDPASRNALISFRPSSNGTYRIQIVDAAGAGGSGPNFLYSLTITAQTVASATPTSTISPTPATTTPTPIPCLDAYEPDDTRDGAKPIELNTSQRHSLCPAGDNDWVTFVATPDKVYTMETLNLTPSVDTVITLYDSQGRQLFENDDYQPGQGLQSRIDWSFTQTGVYFLRIRDKRGSGGIGYEYTVRLSSVGALPNTATPSRTSTINPNSPTPTRPACSDEYENDGVPGDAKIILIGTVQRHSICPTADADWVRFYARAGKVYTIRTANLGPGLDSYMYVFDTDGTKILAQNDDGGEGVASRIDFFPLRDDWYYIQVKNAGDIGGPEQSYDLALTVVPGVPQPPATASPIIAPPVTVTTAPPGATQPAQTPRPPVPSPTQGLRQPTPANQPTLPPPVQTARPDPRVPPPVQTGQPVPPQVTQPAQPPSPTETIFMPNVPRTGAKDSSGLPVLLPNPGKPAARPAPVPLRVTLKSAASIGGSPAIQSGIRGVAAWLVAADGTKSAVFTNSRGEISHMLKSGNYLLTVPYFGITVKASDGMRIELPQVALPDRIP
jgi:hypothetical protein